MIENTAQSEQRKETLIKSKSKLLTILVISLLFLLIGAIGGYYFGLNKTVIPTPTASSASPTWNLDECKSSESFLIIEPIDKIDCTNQYPSLQFIVYNDEKSIQDVKGRLETGTSNSIYGYKISKEESIQMLSTNVKRFYLKSDKPNIKFKEYIVIAIPINNKIVNIELYDLKYQNYIDPILSTFKFLDQTGLKRYESLKLGVVFNYPQDLANIQEDKNKIYVYIKDQKDYTTGQFVEIFRKDPQDSLEQAIKKKFLTSISEKDCYVELEDEFRDSHYPSSYVVAEIAYPTTNEGDQPWWNNKVCPQNYSKTNGMRYFLMDINHPDKFIFVSIGQYMIPVNTDKGWQDTIEFLP